MEDGMIDPADLDMLTAQVVNLAARVAGDSDDRPEPPANIIDALGDEFRSAVTRRDSLERGPGTAPVIGSLWETLLLEADTLARALQVQALTDDLHLADIADHQIALSRRHMLAIGHRIRQYGDQRRVAFVLGPSRVWRQYGDLLPFPLDLAAGFDRGAALARSLQSWVQLSDAAVGAYSRMVDRARGVDARAAATAEHALADAEGFERRLADAVNIWSVSPVASRSIAGIARAPGAGVRLALRLLRDPLGAPTRGVRAVAASAKEIGRVLAYRSSQGVADRELMIALGENLDVLPRLWVDDGVPLLPYYGPMTFVLPSDRTANARRSAHRRRR